MEHEGSSPHSQAPATCPYVCYLQYHSVKNDTFPLYDITQTSLSFC